jgi:pyruvate,orthophosphate dikinase
MARKRCSKWPTTWTDPELLRARGLTLDEFNPMLGHRGCRLAVSYPEIAEMQARAIFEASIQVSRQGHRHR